MPRPPCSRLASGVVVAVLLLVLGACRAPTTTKRESAGPAPPLPPGADTAVVRIVDGDTVVVAGGRSVRLIGIDTPETKDPRRPVGCFGREAAAKTAELLPPGTPVRLVHDVEREDRFGRTLAYVHRRTDGLFVNAALVAGGYALPATYPPNVAHAEKLARLGRRARESAVGLWGACPVEQQPDRQPRTPQQVTACEPSYPDMCLPAPPPDLDCADVERRRFTVRPPDPHRFDVDRNGVGCE